MRDGKKMEAKTISNSFNKLYGNQKRLAGEKLVSYS